MKEAVHLGVQSVKGVPETRGHVEIRACNLGQSCDEEAGVGPGEEQRRPQPQVRHEVAVRRVNLSPMSH